MLDAEKISLLLVILCFHWFKSKNKTITNWHVSKAEKPINTFWINCKWTKK